MQLLGERDGNKTAITHGSLPGVHDVGGGMGQRWRG
jgi:hypothetical protein